MGGVIFSTTAIVRWDPDLIIGHSNDQSIESILNISALNEVSVALLSIGAFLILLGFIGLIGTMCTSRFFLVLYEILIVIIFLCHGASLLIVTFRSNDVELEFRKGLNKTIEIINSPNTTQTEFKGECDIMRAFSTVFDCCGANGPQDFVNETYVVKCCVVKDYQEFVGCADKTVETVTSKGILIFLAPNATLLGVELILIIMIPFLISRIKREKKYRQDRNINYLRPTTEFRKSYGSTTISQYE